jgi:uncharacterized protein YdaU (DUF1376 family)
LNFYKHHLGDYDGATVHLSWDEDMAYTRLLRAYYRREKPIPDGEKYRLARAVSRAHRAAVDIVLAEFFDLRDDGWHNKRADEEIAAYQAQADTNRRIAQQRNRQRTVNDSSNDSSHGSSTNRPPNHKPEPLTRNQSTPKTSAAASPPLPDWLPSEWGEFERHRREKRAPLTPTARAGCIRKLDRWRAEGKDIAAILRYSIDNGYTGLFEPKPNGTGGVRGQGVTAHNIASAQEWLRREREKDENAAP